MTKIRLGRTDIKTNVVAFGALPIQRVSADYAVMLLKKAYEAGVTFYDTARSYSDSEEKIGLAFGALFEKKREDIFIATKTPAATGEDLAHDLETSLKLLKTDYIDIYQYHNPATAPRPGDKSGLYEAMQDAKKAGKIRHIGITNHSVKCAKEAVLSGLYDSLQFPFSYLATQEEIDLVHLCRDKDVGFIAMKALSGGLITRADAAYAYLAEHDNVLPIWGVQRVEELDELLSFIDKPPAMNDEIAAQIEKDRLALSGDFCRGCAYCMPCPVDIQINNAARMRQLIRRSPTTFWLGEGGQAMMNKIDDCMDCRQCAEKCPYNLDTPELLRQSLADYRAILSGEISV